MKHNANKQGLARREFLRNATVLAMPVAFGAIVPQAFASSQRFALAPGRTRGATVLDVRNYGARGDGSHDDTAAIQAAINALPTDGGTVLIPAGTYMIDTSKKINLRSRMLLQMDPDTILKAKTSSLSRHYILYINDDTDVEIAGGQLIGDRDTHNYSLVSGTHEWGHGIQILGGLRVTVRDLRVAKCTGDGVCIGGHASDVVITNIVSTQNRRQGLSITNCNNIKVYDSEFSFTEGTAPECGIDIEPDAGYSCSNVLIRNCRLNGNKKYGINIWQRVSAVTITGCTLEKNGSLGMGTNGCTDIRFINNLVRENSATGVVYNTGTNGVVHEGNLSYRNYTRLGARDRTPFSQAGWTSKIERDVLIRTTMASSVGLGMNGFR